MDSGCSNHMTKDESIFCRLDKIKIRIKIRNSDYMEATSKDTIAIDIKKGKRYINKVLLLPIIDKKLLSVVEMMVN